MNSSYTIDAEAIRFYQRNRFIKLKQVFSPEELNNYRSLISAKVHEINEEERDLQDRDTYGKAFLQLFNLWTKDEGIKELVFHQRLAAIASQLMQCDGVRLYHDQALFKEAGGGITPWHADQYYWPLASDKTITAWIPLQAVPLEMGPLEFSAGSHEIIEGRELEISDQSESKIGQSLRINDFQHIKEPYDLGEVSFHSGWVFHRAGANDTSKMREVMTVIYMDKDMRLKAPENKGQQKDWDTWCPGAEIGEIINTPLNPVLYEN